MAIRGSTSITQRKVKKTNLRSDLDFGHLVGNDACTGRNTLSMSNNIPRRVQHRP